MILDLIVTLWPFYERHFLDLIMNFMTNNYDLYDLFMNETVI